MSPLAASLQAEAEAASAFVFLLREEQDLLREAKSEALAELLERKNAVVARLSAASAQRNATLAAAGMAADRPGVEAWRAKFPRDEAALREWTRLQQLAQEGLALNRLNGELIHIHLQHNAKLLEGLMSASGRQELYSAAGQAHGGFGQRLIDSA